ncbi:MAG: hypothetical protein WBM08_09375 [Prochlorococcaceae cyanobacterium]
MSLDRLRFEQLLRDVRSRQSSGGTDTMVVAAHLAQMRLFMTRQGVEFFSRQDSFGMRREFIRRVVDFNELPGRMEAIIDSFLIDGKGLFYFRPSKDLYRIHYFTQEQYRSFYDEEGELEEVQIIYSFRVRSQLGYATGFGTSGANGPNQQSWGGIGNQELRWVMMRVFPDRIVQTITTQQPQFDGSVYGAPTGNTRTYVNTLGFIPAVEVFNNRGLTAGEGHGEFEWLSSFIMEHNRMCANIRKNLQFFGTPTLVSSRPRSDLIEPDDSNGPAQRATVAANSGFIGLNRRSTRASDTSLYSGDGIRVPRIIANVEAADRVNYILPDPIPGDLTGYASAYQEMIRASLGGVDDLSISSGATAYEVRTLYGRVAATAKKKCRDLYEYGLCKLFSLMVFREEQIFRDSFAESIGLIKPPAFMPESLPPELRDPMRIQQMQQQSAQQTSKYQASLDQAITEAKETGEFAPGLVGLIPDGDLRVDWRFQGEVFEDSPQDTLQHSIVCRNLQELGVSSIEALQYLFPQKTPEERAAMLTGYPFRMVEATQRSVGVFLDILRGFYQVPHPQTPDLPLAADPSLDMVPYLYRTLSFLQKELSYSAAFNNADPASIPTVLSDADRLRAERGEPTQLDSEREQRRDAFRIAGNQPGASFGMGGGVSGAGGQPAGSDSDALLPATGGVLAFDPANPYPGSGQQLGQRSGALGATDPATLAAAGMAGANGISLGAPDLAVPTNAGLMGAPAGPPGGPPAAAPAPGPGRSPVAAGNGRPGRNGARRPGRGAK